MQQVIQNIRTGKLSVSVLPDPSCGPGEILVANQSSLISAGTEKMVTDLAKKSLIGKARERPDHVRRVLQKLKQDGLREVVRQVKEKLDQPTGLGYSSAGIVIGCGDSVSQYRVGDRVASNGPHASVVAVPVHLSAKIPEQVSFDQASFAIVGSIALQGIRLANVAIGERVLVIGLGLVGQLAVSILKAAGCRVIGTDPDSTKCSLALKSGAERAEKSLTTDWIEQYTQGSGFDSVIITASTKSNAPIELACEAIRPKGRIVLIGVVGLEIPRRPMYFKEAEFVVSCSYGPGRYDSNYEERGIDYPIGHVRWTEQRNIQAVLDLLASGAVQVDHLISHRFDIGTAEKAYQLIAESKEPYVGILLQYPSVYETQKQIQVIPATRTQTKTSINLGVLGAGNFARMTMLPAISKVAAIKPQLLCSAGGLNAEHAAKKFGYVQAVSDESMVFRSPLVDAVMILTRHDLHARQVQSALTQKKHVFVEKPLALNLSELQSIEAACRANPETILTVGFNRRFSKAADIVKKHFVNTLAPLTIQYRFNAGSIPADHWIQHPTEGGGRVIGEACHAIDLVTFLTGSLPVEVYANCISGQYAPSVHEDQCFIQIKHHNGSISSIGYLAGGDRSISKERIEVFGGGKAAIIDDYRSVEIAASGKIKRQKINSGKGHLEEVNAFVESIRSGAWPISWEELKSTTLASIAAVASMREGHPITLSEYAD